MTHPLNLGILPLNLGTVIGGPSLGIGTTRRQTLKNFQVRAPANWLGGPPTGSEDRQLARRTTNWLRGPPTGSENRQLAHLLNLGPALGGRSLQLGTTLGSPPYSEGPPPGTVDDLENVQVRASANWLGEPPTGSEDRQLAHLLTLGTALGGHSLEFGTPLGAVF